MTDSFPRATSLLRSISKDAIIDYLTTYTIGRRAMAQLEAKLNRGSNDPQKETTK